MANIPALRDILTDATRYKIEHGDTSWGEGEFTDDEVTYALTKTNVYVIRVGGEVVASFALDWSDERIWGKQPPTAGYLHRMVVKDSWHGQNIGHQLIILAAHKAKRQKKQFLRLDCSPQNTKLCAYYEKQGFTMVGERQIVKPEPYTAGLYQRAV